MIWDRGKRTISPFANLTGTNCWVGMGIDVDNSTLEPRGARMTSEIWYAEEERSRTSPLLSLWSSDIDCRTHHETHAIKMKINPIAMTHMLSRSVN